LEVREQLVRLVRLQEIAREVRAARALVEGAPMRVEEIENRFRERNAEFVAVQQRYEALDEDQRTRNEELITLEEHKTKYTADLMQVQNQREYAAMLKEIDSVKSQIAEHEEAILKDMEEIESVKTELATHEEHIKAERKLVEKECTEVEAGAESAREQIAKLEGERTQIESELPRTLVSSVHRLEPNRQGLFLTKAEDGVCQSCFVRVRPQGFQEIKLAIKIHACSNCKRLLYHAPTLERMTKESESRPEESSSGGPDTGTVEAVDGGAI
jgi:predicted  nucleic acid-binding Zn-ribbon protein